MKDVTIGNINYNGAHWAAKDESEFVKYYMGKADSGLHKDLFARRNEQQRIELLKGHYAIIVKSVKGDAPKTEPVKQNKEGGK